MSTSVLPVMPGLAWNVQRAPVWSTTSKRSVSGRRYAASNWSYPIWKYKLVYEVLRARPSLSEMQAMAGFFNAVMGSGDSFLFMDPDDCTVTSQQIAVGNGVNNVFQLVRVFGGYVEPVLAPDAGTFSVSVGGTPVSYTLDTNKGLVALTSVPPNGAPIRWSGNFYWRCHFLNDHLDFNQFMKNLWDLKSLEFETEKL